MREENIDILDISLDELEDFIRKFEIDNKFDWLFEQSKSFIRNKKHQHAIVCNKLLLEIKPGFPPAYTQTAASLLKLNRLKEVLDFIDQSEGEFEPKKHHQRHFLYIKAKALFDLGRNKDAEALLFDRIEEYEKKPSWFNYLEILILEKSGKFSEALQNLDKKIKLYGVDDFYTQKKIDLLNKTGEKKKAYEFLKEVLSQNSEDTNLLYRKAKADYDNNDFEEAKRVYVKILGIKEDYSAHLWLGNIYNIEDNKDVAEKHIQRAFELAVSDEDKFHCVNTIMEFDSESTINSFISIWMNKSYESPKHLFYISKLRIKQAKYDEAEDLLYKALELEKNKRYYLDLARIASAKKEYDKADDILVRYRLLDDVRIGYVSRNEYCHNALRRGRFFVALQRFKDFSGLYPEDFQIKSMIVNLYNQLSRFQDVIEYLDNEISKNPENDEAWRVLIGSYYQQQNYFKVISLVEKYSAKFGADEIVLNNHANSLREVGRFEECQDILDYGLSQFPESFLLKMSQAQLYRRLSSEFFFQRSEYHEKALKTHLSIKCSKRHQIRALRNEIIIDFIQLKRFTEALSRIDEFLEENPGTTGLINMKIRVFSKMGNHREAIEYIHSLPDNIKSDPEIMTELASEYLDLDKWDKCNKLLKKILKKSQSYQAYILKIRLDIRRGKFSKAKDTIKKLIRFSPHHAFVLPEIIDFALTDPLLILDLYNHLGIVYNSLEKNLTSVLPIEINKGPEESIYEFENNVSISHIILNDENPDISNISYSQDGIHWDKLKAGISNLKFEPQKTILTGYFPLRYLKVPTEFLRRIRLSSMYALPTEYYKKTNIGQSFRDTGYTMNIVETGLGDQLQYIRTAAILAESLGMNFMGFLESELDIIRDRVTTNPYLYSDLGFKQMEIEEENYQVIRIPLSLQTRFVPAVNQWPTFEKFLLHIRSLIEEQLSGIQPDPDKKLLILLSVDDHNITRLISKLYYPDFEPGSSMNRHLREAFYNKQHTRIKSGHQKDRLTVLLQCRLGDVANIPFTYKNEDIWVIPFNGEVLKANDSNKHHMRYANLEKIQEIGKALKSKHGDQIELKLITDGYDYGIEYLRDYQKLLLNEMGVDDKFLDDLKARLSNDFHQEFNFVDEIVYGENYDNLIKSIDLITNSNILISTNGQFTNEFKMSFAGDHEEFLIVKKLYSNLRVKKSPDSKEMFWETDGHNMNELLDSVSSYIENRINSSD